MPKVYVLNRHGRPLMPCTPANERNVKLVHKERLSA